jgi:hypothetical protein
VKGCVGSHVASYVGSYVENFSRKFCQEVMFQAMLEVMLSYFEKSLKVMLETKSPGGICIDSMKQLCIDIISNQQYVEVSL